MTPKRIQRKRTKGWRMPAGAVYVGRPTIFGNPFKAALDGKRSVGLFRLFVLHRWSVLAKRGCTILDILELQIRAKQLSETLPRLRGKDLCCWCPLDQPCHADVLLEIANEEPK